MKYLDTNGVNRILNRVVKYKDESVYNPKNFEKIENASIDVLFGLTPKILYIKLNTGYSFNINKMIKSYSKLVFDGVECEAVPTNKSGILEVHNAVALDVYSDSNNFGGNQIQEMYGHLDTSKTTSMSHMFFNTMNLTRLDVSSFITKQVTDMTNMFYGCGRLLELDVTMFDTSNVKNFTYMFAYCGSLTSLDCSNFNTNSAGSFEGMFINNGSLHTLYIDNINLSKYTSIYAMFNGNVLTNIYVRGKDVPPNTILLLSYVLDNMPLKTMHVYDASKHASVTSNKISFTYV